MIGEIFSTIGRIALGFVPTLIAMEVAWRISRKKLVRPAMEVKAR